jgi:hypothetical protein
MGIVRYIRWRLSPQGREAYKSYAQGRAEADRLARPPVPRMSPSRTTDLWPDGRTRVTDFDPSGRKTRVHEVRVRPKGRDGLRPRQRRTAR